MAPTEGSFSYDFIVVGSGPAGSLLSSKLAESKAGPSILLLEAGGTNDDPSLRYLAERYFTFTNPNVNYGYRAAPQAVKNGGTFDYSRGKGLGGSTAINFCCFTVGPDADYDEWARIVGDDFFDSKHAVKRRKEIETYNPPRDPEQLRYADPDPKVHGGNGSVQIEFPKKLEDDVAETLNSFLAAGFVLNKDMNSGNPIGVGICPSTSSMGYRSTAASAYLQNPPPNLNIVTDSQVTKILFDGNKARGVVANGQTWTANKEVILCTGSLDTPKLLMLSGIGPQAELEKHKIPAVHYLSGVGKNLQDHPFTMITIRTPDGSNNRSVLADPEALEAAKKQFVDTGSGPLADVYHTCLMTWNRASDELLESNEFKNLPEATKAHVLRPSVPVSEYIAHCIQPPPSVDQSKTYINFLTVLQSAQSTGTVTLASTDPKHAPVCDPQIITHPFDRKNYILAMRRLYQMLKSPAFTDAGTHLEWMLGPKSDSDDDIMKYGVDSLATTWHMSATAKMGPDSDEMACVDTKFKVRGVENLRIADMSVVPFVFNCHVQSVAYVVGAACAERLIAEYKLGG